MEWVMMILMGLNTVVNMILMMKAKKLMKHPMKMNIMMKRKMMTMKTKIKAMKKNQKMKMELIALLKKRKQKVEKIKNNLICLKIQPNK